MSWRPRVAGFTTPDGVSLARWLTPRRLRAVAPAFVFGVGPLLLLALSLIHLMQGQFAIEPETVVAAIVAPEDALQQHIVRSVRLPRLAVGMLSGAALGMAGVMLQAVTRNPLASPATLGVNAGAYLALVAATVFAPGLLAVSRLGVAFGGGVLAAALVYLLAAGTGQAAPIRLALAGVAISLALSAFTGTLQLIYEQETAGLFFWGAGSLVQNDWSRAVYAAPRLAGAVVLALLLARSMDVLRLGDDVARGLGLQVTRTRLMLTGTGVFLAAVSTSIAGPIGFVGLIVPHGVRLAGIRRHVLLLPGAAIWGALTLVAADIAARALNPGLSELPAGVMTALIGTPLFVWLARRAGGAAVRSHGAERALPASRLVRGRYHRLLGGALVLLALALVAGLRLGDMALSFGQVADALAGRADDLTARVVLDLRLPRLLVAAAAGAALAVSGALFQGVLRNPLASPDTLGITSAAGLGSLAVLLVFPDLPLSIVPAAAFGGALVMFALVYGGAWRAGIAPARLALIGIAASAFCAAAINLLVIRAGVRVAVALAWIAGSTYARGWDDLAQLVPWLVLLVPAAWLLSRALDLLGLGDDVARGLGLRLEQVRLGTLLTAVALAASAVSVVGTISFVGLVAPHLGRLLVGGRHSHLIPFSAVLGAAIVVLADTVGRTVLAPAEIPSGLVTALIGAPYFLWMLWHSRKPVSNV